MLDRVPTAEEMDKALKESGVCEFTAMETHYKVLSVEDLLSVVGADGSDEAQEEAIEWQEADAGGRGVAIINHSGVQAWVGDEYADITFPINLDDEDIDDAVALAALAVGDGPIRTVCGDELTDALKNQLRAPAFRREYNTPMGGW